MHFADEEVVLGSLMLDHLVLVEDGHWRKRGSEKTVSVFWISMLVPRHASSTIEFVPLTFRSRMHFSNCFHDNSHNLWFVVFYGFFEVESIVANSIQCIVRLHTGILRQTEKKILNLQ